MGGKRSGEQALRDDLAQAELYIERARTRHRQKVAAKDTMTRAVEEARTGVVAAEAHRDRILAALEQLTAKEPAE